MLLNTNNLKKPEWMALQVETILDNLSRNNGQMDYVLKQLDDIEVSRAVIKSLVIRNDDLTMQLYRANDKAKNLCHCACNQKQQS